MSFAFNDSQPSWTTAQQIWLLTKVKDGCTQRELYEAFTSEDSKTRPTNVPLWTGKFGAFKKRLQRLTRNSTELQLAITNESMPDLDLGTTVGRYQYWVWLAKTTAATDTRTQALQMIEKLAPQFQVDNGELQERTEEMLIGGHKILADAHTFAEVVSDQLTRALSEKCDQWCIDALTDWLTSHPTIIQPVLERVVEVHPLRIVKNETQSEKLMRLRTELRALTEAEVRILEDERDLEIEGDENGSD